jgi:hypothetical protein
MKRTDGGVRGKARAAAALLAALVSLANCDSTTGTDYGYYDSYLSTYYYPADLSYSSYYWANDWYYPGWYAYDKVPSEAITQAQTYYDAGVGGAGGSAGAALGSVGAAVRALARGETVCPGQVTVTPRAGKLACPTTATTTGRAGATIVFNNCVLSGGGIVSGTFDIAATQTASPESCAAGAMITVNIGTTISNLTYTSPQRGKLVIPTQTDMGTTTYTLGQNPTTLQITSSGRVQTFDSSGGMQTDVTFSGSRVFTNSGNGQSYSVDGMLNLMAQDGRSGSGTLTATGITRSGSCCRPTGGTLAVSLTSGTRPGRQTFTFGPSCGAVSREGGNSVSLPACF